MSGIPIPSAARLNGGDRDKDSMWYFTAEELANSPSRRTGLSPDQELSYRQMTAYLIQEMGQRLQVSQLCINTAIVYMHRFYAFHSFSHFHRNGIAAASLFLAAKVEEQPRKLEHVIKAAHKCLHQNSPPLTDAYYLEQAQDLVFNENVLLQTLGFDVAIDHPHTHVVKTCQLVKACKDLAQTSYFLASNSLHLTSMCLQYKPSVVACFCIYLACKWSRWEIPQSTEGKHWFHYVDETVTMDLLKRLTDEFIVIYEKSPARLKSKLTSIKALAQGAGNRQGQVKEKKADQDWKVSDMMNMKMYHPAESGGSSSVQSQSSSSQYSTPGSVSSEQQQTSGSVTQPMLPPPPHQPQQMRKPDMHSSSQHRSHHSSSSTSSSHHPPKIGYSPSDVPDHKLNSGHGKPQQPQQQGPQSYGGNSLVSNRPPREHSSTSMMAPSNSKSSSSSSSRTSMSNNLPGPPIRQSSSQGHPMDVNYHKSRERNMAVPPPTAHGMPPHGMPHKLAQKQDSSRSMSSKDHSGRLIPEQPNKQNNGSSSSSNKMYSSSVPPQYGGNSLQMPPVSSGGNQLSTKLDTMHDITRNIMHSSRSGYTNQPPPPPTNGPAGPLLNYHQQQQQGTRHSSSSSSSNNNSSSNLKHEQSKQQISVHMQQQSQSATHHHKQPQTSMPTDQSYSGLSTTQELQQPTHATSSLINNNYSKVESMQHSDETSHPINPYNNPQAQNQITKSVNSLFSPDWNDKHQGQLQEMQMQQPPPSQSLQSGNMNSYLSNSTGSLTQNSEAYATSAYKMPSSTLNNKESSPKIKIERDAPSKKDKNRSNTSIQDNARSAAGHVPQQMLKTTIPKKMDTSFSSTLTALNDFACTNNTGTIGGSGIKRPNELITVKQEDDLVLRDSKIRKLDTSGGNSDITKHPVVNGIETNPDMVRTLLKESLCSTSGLLKAEPSIVTPSLQPPAELFEPSATTSSSTNQHNTSIISTSNSNTLSCNTDVSAMEIDEHGISGSKSEKKKKKDKHKHKEKEKSKDREERKKHKKDKDRHKEKGRDRDSDNNNAGTGTEHVKIKISKEKLEAAGEPIGFKIKIPKERIMGDLNSGTSIQSHTDSVPPPQAAPVLKIKISKDKLESYSSGSTDLGSSILPSTHPSYSHNQSAAYTSYGSASHSGPTISTTHNSSSSSSSKKKDRDREKEREKDKEKKRNHDTTSSKSNSGGGGVVGNSSLITATASIGGSNGQNYSTSSNSNITHKPQYSSKMHQQSSMSLLFGESNESNDDDDDFADDY